MTRRVAAVCSLLWVCPAVALADEPLVDRSIDTQLVHPALSPDAAVVVDTPRAAQPMELSIGAAWQLERDPLRYQLDTGGGGAVISQRSTVHLGASLAVSERTTVYLRGSAAQLEGGDLAVVAPAQTLALGDVAVGVKGAWFERGPVALGPAVTLWLPVGSGDSWVAEDSFRYAPALLASVGGEHVEVLANLGMLARVEVDTGADFVASPELTTGAAVAVSATPWLGGLVEISSHHGLGHFMQPGAENPAELKAGLRLTHQRWGRVDLLGGTGLGQGYGASPMRLMVSVMGWAGLRHPEPEPEPVVIVPPPPVVPVEPAPPPPVVVAAPRHAWVEHGRIVVDAPIAFEPGSATLLSDAEALLAEVAEVVLEYPQIELLVVQGHADDLGSLGADYELSLRRARVVFERLVLGSVRPARISYRGMGSADPDAGGAPRSVDLLITRVRPLQHGQADVDEQDILLPWSGDAIAAGFDGEKLLGVDGHPILEFELLPEPMLREEIPSKDVFRQALQEHDRSEADREEAP